MRQRADRHDQGSKFKRISVSHSGATRSGSCGRCASKIFAGRLAQLSAVWYLDWLLNLPVFPPLQAMKEESK
jgi:hypothetical protein